MATLDEQIKELTTRYDNNLVTPDDYHTELMRLLGKGGTPAKADASPTDSDEYKKAVEDGVKAALQKKADEDRNDSMNKRLARFLKERIVDGKHDEYLKLFDETTAVLKQTDPKRISAIFLADSAFDKLLLEIATEGKLLKAEPAKEEKKDGAEPKPKDGERSVAAIKDTQTTDAGEALDENAPRLSTKQEEALKVLEDKVRAPTDEEFETINLIHNDWVTNSGKGQKSVLDGEQYREDYIR